MRIAYLINQYPKVSHSFIRREILALEQRGVEIVRIALRGWDAQIVDEEDVLERKRTRYVLRTSETLKLPRAWGLSSAWPSPRWSSSAPLKFAIAPLRKFARRKKPRMRLCSI